MTKRTSLLAALLIAGHALMAQEAAPAPQLELAPTEAPAADSELPLIPEAPATVPKPPGRAIPQRPTETSKAPAIEKKSKTETASDELRQRIRFREVKTRALRDPAVQAEWERAQRAGTDFEKREALKNYYKLLYGRMARIDQSLKPRIAEYQRVAVRRLKQTRVDPTEPLDPQERTERFRGE